MSRRIRLLLLGLAALAAHVVAHWPYTVDDAFITFQYARNLVAGHGLVFYAGGPRAEGFTSPIGVLASVPAFLFDLPPELLAKAVGICATLAIVPLLVLWSRWAYAAHDWIDVSLLATLLYFAAPQVSVHAVAGLETPIYVLSVVLVCALASRHLTNPESPAALCVAALFGGLVRPDGNLFALAVIATTAVLLPSDRRPSLLRAALLFWIVPGLVYFSARFLYFGVALPLPFYLKVADATSFAGLRRVGEFVGWIAVHLGAALIFTRRVHLRPILPAVVGSLALLLFYVRTEQLMGFGFRFLIPTLPVWCVLAAFVVVHSLAPRLAARLPILEAAGWLLVVGLSLALGWGLEAARTYPYYRGYADGLSRAHIPLGKALSQVATPAPVSVVTADAGAISFYSNSRAIDSFGLNDPTIALSRGAARATILESAPQFLVLLSTNARLYEPLLAWEEQLYDAARRRGYEQVAVFQFRSGYYLWVLARDRDVDSRPIRESNGNILRPDLAR